MSTVPATTESAPGGAANRPVAFAALPGMAKCRSVRPFCSSVAAPPVPVKVPGRPRSE